MCGVSPFFFYIFCWRLARNDQRNGSGQLPIGISDSAECKRKNGQGEEGEEGEESGAIEERERER